MMGEAPLGTGLVRFALEGSRVRRAASVFEREGPRLIAGLRRSVPFLSRRGVPITLSYARAQPLAELVESLGRPLHMTRFMTSPSQGSGALLLDAAAASLLLDGVLGGDGSSLPVLSPSGLTSPQNALVSGLAGNILRGFSVALDAGVGCQLREGSVPAEEGRVDSAPVTCVLELGDGGVAGRIALALPREALLTRSSDADPAAPAAEDPRIRAVMNEVELLLVAELGRIPMPLGRLANLQVGDTLRLGVPVNGLVSVRANGQVLMRGRPTTSGGRLAVKILADDIEPQPSAPDV